MSDSKTVYSSTIMSSETEGKLVWLRGVPYRLCMWTLKPLRKYYAYPNPKGERKGCFEEPMCAVAWVKGQVENGKMHPDKARHRLTAIRKDLDLSDTEPLFEAPLVSPTNPDYSYRQGLECAHMLRFPAVNVDDTVNKEALGGGKKKTIGEKRKASNASTPYKTDKKLYAYELAAVGERTEVTTVDYRDFQDCQVLGDVLALQTYKSKDVILLYGGDSVPNRRAEAMFPGTHLTGTVYILSRKPLHDDGVGSGNTVISEKHATQVLLSLFLSSPLTPFPFQKKPRKKLRTNTAPSSLPPSSLQTLSLF
jgi:hypothetical protein